MTAPPIAPADTATQSRPARPSATVRALDVAAFVVVWLALVVPNDMGQMGWSLLWQLPLEAICIGALALVVPLRAVRPVAIALGLVLGLLVIVKLADMGFLAAFGRPFRPPWDVAYLGSGIDLLATSIGRTRAWGFVAVAGVIILLVLSVLPWAMTRVMLTVRRKRSAARQGLAVLGVLWLALAVWGTPMGSPVVASADTSRGFFEHVNLLADGVRDGQTFNAAAAVDPLRLVPDAELFKRLRGKDVIVAFVESYGRVALADPQISPGVRRVLDDGTASLAAAGFQARSAYLTSPTFGGLSWLAHSTLQSGLWVDSQQRYDQLLTTNRSTLSSAFHRAGWRTVSDVPSNEQAWTDGQRFYGYDVIYDAANVGYRGPKFSYAAMPDQYVLDAFRRLELERSPRPPVMAEIDLVSSHTPWTPLPAMVPWSAVGDGSVFDAMPGKGLSKEALWRDPGAVRAAYGQSIEYTLSALISFVQTYGDDNLVLVLVGDHQPATIVTGNDRGHDVPISIISRDPSVLGAIAPLNWEPGLRPSASAPVTRMDEFRNQFIRAFSS